MELDRDILRQLPFALRVEIEENAVRKDLTQSELAEQQVRILAELRKHAKPGARTDLTSGKTLPKVETDRATDVVGKLFGESREQVKKRIAVVEAAKAEPEKFGRLVEDMDRTGKVDRAHQQLKIERQREAYDSRKEQGAKVNDLAALATSGRRFSVILADPPWSFHTYSGKGKQRSAERHYDCMSLDDIKALPVASLAADDCALFLWSVCPELPGALDVIRAWGFEFKTKGFTWIKQNPGGQGLHTGMGYWTRANSEDVLLATRGNPPRLAMDVHQVIMAPVAEHSEKPGEIHRRIERLLAGPYLELFARAERPGWATWGNEIGIYRRAAS
jgi:N6-adenosine-specific RNA methylase IME4